MTVFKAIVFALLASAVTVICYMTDTVIMTLLFLSAVFIHEAGHIVAALICKVPLSRFRVSSLGIRLTYDFSVVPHSYVIIICVMGSIASFSSAAIAIYLGLDASSAGVYFILSSLTLGSLNLLPVKGLDGGVICESALAVFLPPDTAYRAAKNISVIFIILFWVLTVETVLDGGVNLSMLALSVYLLYSSL